MSRGIRGQLRDAVLARILDGTYPPGHRLVELRLAAEFHTSQAPVREALRELAAMRYVESRPNRGTYVRSITPEEMRDSFRVRALLERAAVEAAAKTVRRAKGGDHPWLARLRALVEAIEQAAASGDRDGYIAHDSAFHQALIERANNAVLVRHWKQLVTPTRAVVALSTGRIDFRDTAPEHRPILDAIEAGTPRRAGALAYAHMAGIGKRLTAADATPRTASDGPTRSRVRLGSSAGEAAD